MIIDAAKLHERYVPRVKSLAIDERFYDIPGATGYCISTYGRVYREYKQGKYRQVKESAHNRYEIKYDNNGTKIAEVEIEKLIKNTFFCDKPVIVMPPMDDYADFCENNLVNILIGKIKNPFNLFKREHNNGWQKWNVCKLLVLDKNALIEHCNARMEHREPQYRKECKEHSFINRYEPQGINMRKYIHKKYQGMYARALSKAYKKHNPCYADTTMCKDWIKNPYKCKQYLLDIQYQYDGDLSVDKDILTCGEKKIYAPGCIAFMPQSLNNAFSSNTQKYGLLTKLHSDGTEYYYLPGALFALPGELLPGESFENYEDALNAGRKKKAEYLRKLAKKEKEKGLPDSIVNMINICADRCEAGLIEMFEQGQKDKVID